MRKERGKKVAIVGGGPTRRYAPFHDKNWDIWAFSSRDYKCPRVTRWFEIHAPTDLRQQLSWKKPGRRSYANYVNFMRKLKCPVYMQKRYKYIPNSVPFPLKAVLDEFGRCFTSTASYLVALAILEGYQVIGLWGINPKGKEYGKQREALEYLLSVARQRGIRLVFPKGVKFRLSKRPKPYRTKVLYGYDWRSPRAWWRYRLRLRHRFTRRKLAKRRHRLRRRDMARLRRRVVLRRRLTRTIYRAHDVVPGRTVIVKRYDRWHESVAERDIMRAYGKSPYLVRFYGWRVKRGKGYIIMEFADGPTVNELVAKRGPLPPAQVVALASNVLKGLDELHGRRIVHGDLHGDNVIVTNLKKAKIKIIDFQHAVKMGRAGHARARRSLANPPPHLAPESRGRYIDERYDIYGVGFMCASMLAGKVARTPAELRKCATIDSPLRHVVVKALHPDPSQRYSSARAMMDALRDAGV